METFGLIILAAGASTRLGEPKQLLLYNGQSLLKHAVDVAIQVVPVNTFVVLGAHADLIHNELADLPVHVINNTRWKEGMASSIHAGISAITSLAPAVNNVIFMVCDQPFVSGPHIAELMVKRKETSKHIIASAYNNTVGTPVIFSEKYFPDLLTLQVAEGAKHLLKKYADDVFTVPISMGHIDVDTYDDYKKLLTMGTSTY